MEITEQGKRFELRPITPTALFEVKTAGKSQSMGYGKCPYCGRQVSFWTAGNTCATYCGCMAKIAPIYHNSQLAKYFARSPKPVK